MMAKLRLGSFNCRGFKSSKRSISELMEELDFLAIQEHWFSPNEFVMLSSVSEDVMYCAASPMGKDEILLGRAYGGVALLWHRWSHYMKSPLSTVSDRIVAVRVKSSIGIILVVAVYLLVNYGDTLSLNDYISEIGYLESNLDMNDHDEVIILGDFNADLRSQNSRMSRQLASFISDWDLFTVGLNDPVLSSKASTWHRSDFGCQSWIDYFLVSGSLSKTTVEFEIRENGGYLSDHWPIILSTDVSFDHKHATEEVHLPLIKRLW